MSLFYTNETNTLKNHKEKVGDIMTSLKSINRRVGSLFAVAALVLATITPGLIPAFASAAQVTERSVELSSSSKAAEDVNYTVEFTTVGSTALATVLQFCENSPLIGAACTAPSGFDASAATATGYTISQTDQLLDNTIVAEAAANGTVVIPLENIDNPTNAGPLYVRIVTYSTTADAADYVAATLGNNVVDQGSAAVSITDTVAVSGAVLESMTFCVSGALVTVDGCASGVTAPTLKLGKTSGSVVALDASEVSEGSIYSQISTNAVSGAVVNLKSSATDCGGLLRSGAPTACDIAPAGTGGIAPGAAKFGVKVAAATNPNSGTNSNGTFQGASDNAYYNDSVFKLNFVALNASGVTGPFGDTFLDTDGAPASNKNVQITFGASVANNTPAGLYSTDLSLIATGKF